MWDVRYSTAEYVYGTEPNEFLVSVADQIPKGRVLSLAEGEGRNGVYLAGRLRDSTSLGEMTRFTMGIREKKGPNIAFLQTLSYD